MGRLLPPMQAETRRSAAASIGATLLVGGAVVVWPGPVVGWLLIAGAVPVLLWGWWPKLSAARKRRREKRDKEEQARKLRGESFEARLAWDRFYESATKFLAIFYEDAPRSRDWLERLRVQWEDAAKKARLLEWEEPMIDRIAAFKPLVDGSDPGGNFEPKATALKGLLRERRVFYAGLKKGRAGGGSRLVDG